MTELGSILGDIIYMVEDKKPAVRHINLDMKKMLKRMKQIHKEVSDHLEIAPKDAQLTKGCHKCDSTQPQKPRSNSPAATMPGKQTAKCPKSRNTGRSVPSTVGELVMEIFTVLMRTSCNVHPQLITQPRSDAGFKGKVSGIRRTAAGEIPLRMNKASDESTGRLQKAIQDAIVEQAEVKAMADKVTVEIRDIAKWTTSDEVLEAVFQAIDCDLSSEAVPKLRPAYQGTQTATLILPKNIADHILNLGKLRIGWAVCRMRAKLEARRCFNCLNFGHIAARCRSKFDASKLCLNCGGQNHAAKDCSSEAACIICKRSGENNTAHSTLIKLCPRYLEAIRKLTN
ncbi:hypothetical protein ACLKA6_001114 [Drosophila palustris]